MAQLADFISRIFSTGRTQGLSGGAEVVLDPDPAAAFYASRLRRHQADGDYVVDPSLLWDTTSYQSSRGGLRAHIQVERGEGIASFTDVLVVVSQADARRAAAQPGEAWTERAARQMGEAFSDYCLQERFELLYGTRPLRFRLVADGGKEMLSQSFGLQAGEFVTGLLPNLYVGPAMRSRPVLAVHLNIPGVWQGYREVGRLYSDQIVFTLGRHWLDNFAHPALREPGIYRLQQYPDGSLMHVISPELQDRYCVRSDQTESGPSVLTIAELDGRPVAFLVLAVVESTTVELPMADVPRPEPTPAAARRQAPAVPAPSAAAPAPAPEPAARPSNATMPPAGLGQRQKTIVPGASDSRILTLQERGALLQRVHFGNFMEGYDVYLGPQAQVATSSASMTPRATIQVRFARVSLVAHAGGVKIDGKALEPGKPVLLAGSLTIEVDGTKVDYNDLSGVKIDGWPYLGELRRPGAGNYLDFGAVFQLGRDRRSKVRLPDEPHNDNIAWLPSVGGGATIRSRTGDIQKSKFYTDSIMVASTHAEVDLTAEPVLRSLARHCYTFVRRGDEVHALFPREGAGGLRELPLESGDEVMVGNCLFQVSFPPVAPVVAAPVSSEALPRFTANELAAMVDAPAAEPRSFATVDPVEPAGLGRTGPPPRPVRSTRTAAGARAKKGLTGAESVAEDAAELPPSVSQDLPLDATDLPSPVTAHGRVGRPPASVVKPAPSSDDSLPPSDSQPLELPTPRAAPPPRVPLAPRAETRPPPPPPSAPTPKVAPPMLLDDHENDAVVSVEEKQWQQELARPARLVQLGWAVHGEFTLGNHRGSDMIVPEVRAFPDQAFMTLDYCRVYARGKKGRVELLQPGEVTVLQGGKAVRSVESLADVNVQIVRRDQNLEPDFHVSLRFAENPGLADPRAQLLEIDVQDRLVAALFTRGLPHRNDRRLKLGPVTVTFHFDGAGAIVSNYLDSYRTGAQGFVPFFYQSGTRPWRTMPEDGSPVTLQPGDGLLAGTNVYRFEVA
jgi:hypothetical protein